MVISRGVAGFGAGGEYPTCATGATEAADESAVVRANRGVLVALSTLFAIDMVITPKTVSSDASSLMSSQGFVLSGVVAIIVLLCYGNVPHEGIWRICFGIGIIVS